MFHKKADELFNTLGPKQIMVLATSANNKVKARSMSFIILGQKLLFQTDKNFCKYEQITSNPNVAICFQNIQIEGTCKEIGHPLSEDNSQFASSYKDNFKGSYDNYSHLPNETVFEVTPHFITVWSYDNGLPYREFYDFLRERYWMEYYDI